METLYIPKMLLIETNIINISECVAQKWRANMKHSDVYNSISDMWDELEATLEECYCSTDATYMLLRFLKNYVRILHKYSNEMEGEMNDLIEKQH